MKNNNVAVLATGTIAAKKTVPLVHELNKAGYCPTVLLTRVPEQWGWVDLDEARAASGREVLNDKSSFAEKKSALDAAEAIVVIASADFASQLVYATTDLARAVLDAKEKGARLVIVPAMNFKIWEHPAVRENFLELDKSGALLLGPVEGPMACHDTGFGRMMDVKDIVAGLRAAAAEQDHPTLHCFDEACAGHPQNNPVRPLEDDRIVVVLSGSKHRVEALEKMVSDLENTGLIADYILDPAWAADATATKILTGRSVLTEHFQLDPEGMEHIRLPERAKYVFVPFIDQELAVGMLQGRGGSLCLDAYIASKAPVVTTEEELNALPKDSARRLRNHGIGAIDNVARLANGHAASSAPPSSPR
jgi:phosphopantothenoylcysteine synthetase/decarboxylase